MPVAIAADSCMLFPASSNVDAHFVSELPTSAADTANSLPSLSNISAIYSAAAASSPFVSSNSWS